MSKRRAFLKCPIIFVTREASSRLIGCHQAVVVQLFILIWPQLRNWWVPTKRGKIAEKKQKSQRSLCQCQTWREDQARDGSRLCRVVPRPLQCCKEVVQRFCEFERADKNLTTSWRGKDNLCIFMFFEFWLYFRLRQWSNGQVLVYFDYLWQYQDVKNDERLLQTYK